MRDPAEEVQTICRDLKCNDVGICDCVPQREALIDVWTDSLCVTDMQRKSYSDKWTALGCFYAHALFSSFVRVERDFLSLPLTRH